MLRLPFVSVVFHDPEFTFVMGEADRFLEARFYSEVMAFRGEGNLINDENKVDGSAVLLSVGNFNRKTVLKTAL